MVENPHCEIMDMPPCSEPSVAEVLSDLNLFYIRQIGRSLQKHVGLQDRLEKEIKIRDGSIRLMAQCTHENQLLEAAKTLHTSNARTFAYMNELQKLKAAEVMDSVMDEPGFSGENRICKGRIAISDIRIPLIWKDQFSSNKSKDNTRYASFCLLTVGSEVQDTELVCIDKSTTDISFGDVVVFENASYGFELRVDVMAIPMSSSSSVSAPTPQKLMSRLTRTMGRSEGKRCRERINSAGTNSKVGPQYEKLASMTLTLEDVGESLRSHDLDKVTPAEIKLPLYDNVTFRLVAQPKWLTDSCVAGFLNFLEMIGSVPSWTYLWCEVKAGFLRGWKNPEDCAKTPHFKIDILQKDTKINEIEKCRQKRSHSFQVRDLTERNIFAAEDRDSLVGWIRGLRQHKNDHSAWSAACPNGDDVRKPMFIASPSPRKVPSDLIFDRGIRKTFIYNQLGNDTPIKAMTEAIKCTDMLREKNIDPEEMTSSVQTMLLQNQTTAPWASFFMGPNGKPPKVTKITNIASVDNGSDANNTNNEDSSGQDSDNKPFRHKMAVETSGSDDAFLSDSDENPSTQCTSPPSVKSPHPTSSSKKKRRAPQPPRDKPPRPNISNTPPPKPPLPKILPKGLCTRSSLSSGSSLDDILEEKRVNNKTNPTRHQRQKSAENILLMKSAKRGVADGGEEETASRSSKIKIDAKTPPARRSERIWEKKRNFVMPDAIIPLVAEDRETKPFERSQSLDVDGFTKISSGNKLLSPPSVDEVVYADPDGCRPRTNTLPSVSPSRSRSRIVSVPNTKDDGPNKKPVPTPRKSYLTAVESNQMDKKHIYEIPFVRERQGQEKYEFRQLPFDTNSNVYIQTKPPALPPKLKKQKENRSENREPVYAKIDKEKKKRDRAAARMKSEQKEAAYAKAHQAVINVCKQQMEEKQNDIEDEPIQTYNVVNREMVSRV